jgi:hypothetical protein
MIQKPTARTRILRRHYWAEKRQLKGSRPSPEYLESAAGPKGQFEGPKSYLKCLVGAAGPKVQFEEPKSYLEYLEGAAGPKGQFEGPKSYLEYLVGTTGPKVQFEHNFDQKFPRRSKCSTKDRVIEKLYVYSDGTKERSTKDLEGNSVERPSECKGYIPLGLERTFASLCPLGRKEINVPQETRHCGRYASSSCHIIFCRNGLTLPGLDVWWALWPHVSAVDRV